MIHTNTQNCNGLRNGNTPVPAWSIPLSTDPKTLGFVARKRPAASRTALRFIFMTTDGRMTGFSHYGEVQRVSMARSTLLFGCQNESLLQVSGISWHRSSRLQRVSDIFSATTHGMQTSFHCPTRGREPDTTDRFRWSQQRRYMLRRAAQAGGNFLHMSTTHQHHCMIASN